MRRIPSCAAAIVFTVFLLPPSGTAHANSLCLPDDRSSLGAAASLERFSGAALRETQSATEQASEYLSIQGTTDYVYGAFSGCGERFQYSLGDALTLSYSTAGGVDPFDRIADRAHDQERFFDAAFESSLGELGRIGYAASLHTAATAGSTLADRVTGSRVWFSSPDGDFQLSSEMAVSASDTQERMGTAQRHQISFRLFESASSSLTTDFSFSSVDRDFKGRRSAAMPDRQALGAKANLRAGDGTLSLTFRRAQDNLDGDRDRATHLWHTIAAEGSYSLGQVPLLPNRVRIYANHTEKETLGWGPGGLTLPVTTSGAAGLAMNWTDWLAPGAGLGADALTLSTNLVADWTAASDTQQPDAFATGANARLSVDLDRLLAIPGHVGTGAQVTADRNLEDGFRWHWDLLAELDGLDLLFDTPSSRAAYLLGRFGSGIDEQATGLEIDYRGILAAGIRF